ncbi:MAG TPA: type II toxin-antitoxin system VapC family toxin [Vicinamibacteria bacterium]|nr:type II toxin-antitoxin system VapC family toxin [Vicinamibacteria bacterium]
MIVPDVNLLLYAHVTAFPEHARARRWWESLMNGRREVGVAAPALFGFVRLASNPRVLDRPLSVESSLAHVAEWLARPHVHFLQPGPRHLEIAFGLLRHTGVAANLTTDAQLAAIAIEHQGELHSNDSDFGRFPRLRWVNPIA